MKQKKKWLAYAIALAVSASVPTMAYAAPEENSAELQKQDAVSVPEAQKTAETAEAAKLVAEAEAAKPAEVEKSAAEAEAKDPAGEVKPVYQQLTTEEGKAEETKAAAEDPEEATKKARAEAWAKGRPEEAAIQKDIDTLQDLTVVDIVYEGASDKTLNTTKAATHMKAGDKFTTKAIAADRDSIYNTGYFYDIYPTFEKVPEGVVIKYHLLENPILNSIKIKGNEVEKDDVLYGLMTVRTGTILNNRILHENIQAIQEQYKKDGYILAKVTDMNIDDKGDLTIKINEGKLEGYAVKGNEKTKDYVILREMRQQVGTPFNSKLAKRSMQRVYNLGFFEDVNIKMNPGVEPNAVIMEIDVKEKRTGNFGIGAGYSSSDGIIGMISVADTNFRGTGDAVSLSYSVSGDDTDAHGYTFSYRHPWLDKKETSGTLKVYNRTYEYDDYDEDGDLNETYMRKYSGGEVTLSRPVSEYSTNYVTLRSRDDEYVKHIDDGGNNRSAQWIKDNFGTTNSVTLAHVTDTRDNIYNPTEGGRVELSGEVAGIGGDFDYQKFSVEDQRYFKVGRAQVLALRGKVGAGHGDLSYFNKFRIGGQTTLRGYREDQFRGSKIGLFTVEYRFPIVKQVQGALFTDWGTAWDDGWSPDGDTIKGSVGVGLSLNTPLGPLRLDYGRGSDGGRVHFTVGGSF